MGVAQRTRRIGWAGWLVGAALLTAACGSGEDLKDPSRLSPSSTSSPPPTRTQPSPGSLELVDLPLDKTLPRSVEFAGARFTVTKARITNLDVLRLSGTPQVGTRLFAVVEVSAESITGQAVSYRFDDKAFHLRTWSGQMIAAIDPIGGYEFGRVRKEGLSSDSIMFPVRDVTLLDGAALVIGIAPDALAILHLTAAGGSPEFPKSIGATPASDVQIGEVAWTFVTGFGGLDRPSPLCCPETGDRANVDELYVTLTLKATARGTQYGRANVLTGSVRLIADGVEIELLPAQSALSLPEGASADFELHALIPRDPQELYVTFLDQGREAGRLRLSLGGP